MSVKFAAIKPINVYTNFQNKNENSQTTLPVKHSCKNDFEIFDKSIANINRALISNISFKGYFGDSQPVKKLFWNLTGRNDVYEDNWTNEHIYQVKNKKWVNAPVNELLKRTPEQAVQSIMTLTKPNDSYPYIPDYIPTPDFGDKWGRKANYIEINPRTVAKYNNGRSTEGLFGVMKLLPAIPTSFGKVANCIVLSELYPALWGEDASLYGVNLHTNQQISDTLLSEGLYGKMGADEQVKAFNDLAHLLGFKTGFRMPVLSGEINIQGRGFNWDNPNDRKSYTDALVWGLELGFDCVYFDSAKHVIDKDCMYQGLGDTPNAQQFAEVMYYARKNSHKDSVSFVGEKCNDNYRYKDIGLSAGTDWGKADDFNSVLWESQKQSSSDEYAAGAEVSNDNDYGNISYEQRLNRLNSVLFAYDNTDKKLPSYMQINDIFPLSPYTNTHEQMEHKKQMTAYDGWQECEKHWNGVFNNSEPSREYTQNVYHLFEHYINANI